MRRLAVLAILLSLLSVGALRAQAAAGDGPPARAWSGFASLYLYVFEEDDPFLLPIVAVDHRALHLEGRYNYEESGAASLWVGWNLGWQGKVSLDVTPMVGAVAGGMSGLGPGMELTLGLGPVELYSETEFVVDLEDSSGNFAYTWSELTVQPLPWLRTGLLAQRTRLYRTDLDIQRGILAEVTVGRFSGYAAGLNLLGGGAVGLFGLSASF